MHKDGKWAKQIISLQDEEGKWGCFHSLSQFYDAHMTTEQALRRLEILGFSMEAACIHKAVDYMNDCLAQRKVIPDRREQVSDWDVFSRLILATWIRRFTDSSELANQVADQWSRIISEAFRDGEYNEHNYISAYRKVLKPKYGRINDFSMFYPISLVRGCLDSKTERAMVRFLLNRERGIYYIYDRKLSVIPVSFQSREASRYLGAIELLAGFPEAKAQLAFVADWLMSNRNENGKWDMGKTVKDNVYFPLSDDWRRVAVREADCTERIEKLLKQLN